MSCPIWIGLFAFEGVIVMEFANQLTRIKEKTVHEKRGSVIILFVLILIISILAGGCSSTPTVSNEPDSDFSISEYNADVDHITQLLKAAQDYDHQIETKGNPDNFTSQQQFDAYNDLVNKYNAAADSYTTAARAFNEKYGGGADGTGTAPTDPDNIKLPSKK